ncbi:hypothetical protein MPL3365_140248 [Mesorhizobium plurifarium]|uniref:Uncharacterized protein n=1 Tax=Mesorhizobium plurifarium TaxID=69974 RepID=A0A090FY32_MESPL|nr:hypothetical protein MPL3365_140248 [Mesorhizobium plurifarium]
MQRRGLDAGALGCRCNETDFHDIGGSLAIIIKSDEGRIVYPATRPSQPAALFQGV